MSWRTADWTLRHRTALNRTFVVCCTLGIVADLVLVLWLSAPSITERTWAACREHPVIAVAGGLATVWVCWLVRTDWRLAMFAGMLGGHLWTCF